MNFTWRRFLNELKPVAVFVAALLGYLGFVPKLIFLGIIIWQIVTRGSTIKAFFVTVVGWIKSIFKKDETMAKKGKGKGGKKPKDLNLRMVDCGSATPIPQKEQERIADWFNNGYTDENTGGVIGLGKINVYAYYGFVRFGQLPRGVYPYLDTDYNFNDVVYQIEIRDSQGTILDSGCIDNGVPNGVSDFETSVPLTTGMEVHIVNIPNVNPRVL